MPQPSHSSSRTALPSLAHLEEVLPDQLLHQKRFLVWKEEPHPKNPEKRIKVPYYSSGKRRSGPLGSDQDLAQLVTLPEAFEAATSPEGRYSGIGFALVGEGIGAFDLDNCLDEDGHLIESHAGADLVTEAEVSGAYIEVSPSGRGLRIVGASSITEAYSRDGLEYWGTGRFITLTGDVWANPKRFISLEEFRTRLRPLRPVSEHSLDEDETPIITPRLISNLRSALASVNADERELWVRMGLALKGLGDKGFQLWDEWSKTSYKYDREDSLRVWESLRPKEISYKSVFTEAQENWGWENPEARRHRDYEEDEPEELEGPIPISSKGPEYIPLGDMVLHPTEFVLDGFLPTGVTVIAGAWGAGKSTNLIPLFASVAHLTPEEWGFWPQLRRKVIWVTEAPTQARDTIYSIAKSEGSASWQEFQEWFHLYQAKRQPPKIIAKFLRRLVEELTYELPNGFKVAPALVLDTTSANLDLENESDNSEVGAAMAELKQGLTGVPLTLIGHTPKALAKSDVSDITFRGAGAWEADSVATYFLVHDPDTDIRFLAIRKCRFTPSYSEIQFDHRAGSEIVDTPWGEPQSKSYLHGIPVRSTGEQRRAAQEAIREERREQQKERALSDRQTRIMAIVSEAAASGELLTKKTIQQKIGGKTELAYEAINRLMEAGRIKLVDIPEGTWTRRGPVPEGAILPSEVDPELFFGSGTYKEETED